jgi:hypothetical protein
VKPTVNRPKENQLEYEFQQAWIPIRKIKDERASANQGYITQ